MNRRFFMIAAPLALAGCGGRWSTAYQSVGPEVSRNWRLAGVSVSVPQTLSVSEANTFAPNADIVWHGDPPGDRRAQVAAVLKEGITLGGQRLNGPRAVTFGVTLQNFHAVTPKAVTRAPAAVHNIGYVIQVFDAQTAAALTQPTEIQADIEANVGAAAILAAQQGESQKVRIVRHLALVTEGWLGIGPNQQRTFTSLGR